MIGAGFPRSAASAENPRRSGSGGVTGGIGPSSQPVAVPCTVRAATTSQATSRPRSPPGPAPAATAALSSLAVAADLAAGTLCAVPVSGLDLRRTLRAVWPTAA